MARCYICDGMIRYERELLGGRFEFRGARYAICQPCRGRYWRPVEQAAKFGKRFPFVLRSEVPVRMPFGIDQTPAARHRQFSTIFHILTLARGREEIRGKEVMWMTDDMTRKILKLPDRIAAIVAKTYAVMGDDFKLSDDQALQQIRDLLEDIDPEICMKKRKRK